MGTPVSSLQQDHRLLLELTDALEAFAGALPRAESVPIGHLQAFARAFRELADQLLYEKAEHVLMPFLARHGYDWNGELLARIREDHNQNRYLIDVLYQAAQRKGGFSKDDHRRLACTAAALVSLQRRLLQIHDVELFPAVASSVASEALARLRTQLSEFDYHQARRTRRLKRLVGALSLRYGKRRADLPS